MREIQNKLDRKQDGNENGDSKKPSMLEAMMEMVENDPECMDEAEFREHMLTFVATVRFITHYEGYRFIAFSCITKYGQGR